MTGCSALMLLVGVGVAQADEVAPAEAPPTAPLASAARPPAPAPIASGAVEGAAGIARPASMQIDYASYGVAVSADILTDAGATCRQSPGPSIPCILGSGGGLVLRGGYRSAGPWYLGGAYQFSKTDSSNLYRLAILQQLRAEMRYAFELGYRAVPYATWGVGGVVYGNEWAVETGGASAFIGAGFETYLSRSAVVGAAIYYQPMVFAGFVDTADFDRAPGFAQYLRIELLLEIRSEISRD